VVLVIRSRRPFWRSKPSSYLLLTTFAVVAASVILLYLPVATLLELRPVSARLLIALAAIVVGYIAAAEAAKTFYYRWIERRS
jgi:P-type Mg2+ transporter